MSFWRLSSQPIQS